MKKVLIHQINEINDISLLKAIKRILDLETDSEVLTLTQEQKEEIIQSKKEIEKGLYIENEAMHKEVIKWLNGK